jgi:peptide/nickel transport system substrate-binding protein
VDRTMKRREFIKVAAAGAVGAVASACAPQTVEVIKTVEVEKEVEKEVVKTVEVEKEVEKVVEVEVPQGFAEAPMLAAKVAAGELPPVEERLPENPVVVGGRDSIGVYGGEVRQIHNAPEWFTENYDWNSERLLQYSDYDLKTIVGNVFESWEVSEDASEWTIMMRKGMKWSDGVPVTTEDIRFWWEDLATDPDVQRGVPRQFRFGGENMVLEIIDEYTFKCIFATGYGNFAAQLTRYHQSSGEVFFPSHFLKQYHAKYADEADLAQKVADRGVESWVQLVSWSGWSNWGVGSWYGPPGVEDYPVSSPWKIVSNPESGLYLWERNPYYWKVDQAGNQLPYIDTLRFDYIQDPEQGKLKLIQNELDTLGMHTVTMADYPFYKENEANGNYQVADLISCMTDRYKLFPNHYLIEDPVLTEIANHPNFVKALSVAIDRSEVNETLFFGLARVGGDAVNPVSKYYKPSHGEAWAQYDPDLANQLLDEMGLDQRDSEGFRLRPDGQRLTYQIEHAGIRVGASTGKYTEMVVTYWREIGIDATTREIAESLYNERMNGYQVHCGIWHNDRCTDLLFPVEPHWYIPTGNGAQGSACPAWVNWYNAADRTAEGQVTPPEEIQALMGYFDQMQAVISEDERVELGQRILDYLAETPLQIGLVLENPAPLLFNKNMRNLPRPKSLIGWDTWGLSTYHPEAFYYEGGERA